MEYSKQLVQWGTNTKIPDGRILLLPDLNTEEYYSRK